MWPSMSTGVYKCGESKVPRRADCSPLAAHARAIVSPMIPLAVSGPIVIGVAVAGAVLLVGLLLRDDDRYQAEQEREHDR